MPESPARTDAKIARAALVLGLLGVTIGVFVWLGEWLTELAFMQRAEPVPYALGAISMLLAIVSVVFERRYRLGVWGFLAGVAAALIVPGLWYAVLALIAFAVVAAVTSA